jgi:hypothetical protein
LRREFNSKPIIDLSKEPSNVAKMAKLGPLTVPDSLNLSNLLKHKIIQKLKGNQLSTSSTQSVGFRRHGDRSTIGNFQLSKKQVMASKLKL